MVHVITPALIQDSREHKFVPGSCKFRSKALSENGMKATDLRMAAGLIEKIVKKFKADQ